ncbi:hypothetical protein ACFL0V_00580 [Nanoarchaeota archaeon]
MIELEKTYLAKEIPKGLENCESKEVIDVYYPKESKHPVIRLRKNGPKYELTKKQPIDGDASEQMESTIKLTEFEFKEFSKLEGKEVSKIRYYYPFGTLTAEVDVFQGALKGLVLVDFEFESSEEKAEFEMPDFCLADVTPEVFIAGGMVCGKSYSDIQEELARFDYEKLHM